ncbi:RsmB/NOP family class I SAM-dependent RNA methyltransferase [uncultured Treponema sp.]|uniref:RsmB/NOP family class I SAM-dependent RNA methyltransferase n=1 Tax=uncultured Treponema sp. TaxID=162155 RepID=UPI002630DC5C|nr:RsmB/NOP family class I SAM-dependent RNA methyltransferase [uncultured Treponema sp.]
MKKTKAQKVFGQIAFEKFYSEIFGERWENLKSSLAKETLHAELSYKNCESYFLDPASIVAALCLPVKHSEKILDLCAAPGGKTLVLAGNKNADAVLFSNERSPSRKVRLSKVVESSLPPEISCNVKVSLSDGASWCRRESECYESILLDAPCSSERHVLNDKKYLEQWTPSRIKTVSMEQWALLSCAYRLLKKNGFLLYATCALCPQENDGVVSKLLKKFPDVNIVSKNLMEEIFDSNRLSIKADVLCPQDFSLEDYFLFAEKTEFGFHILPDKSFGAGPIYFSLIKKS